MSKVGINEPEVPRNATSGVEKVEWVQPPPLVINREWLDTDPAMPGSAVKLMARARGNNWEASPLYSQGVRKPKPGTSEPVVIHVCGVRLARGAQRAYSSWISPIDIEWEISFIAAQGGRPGDERVDTRPFGFTLSAAEMSDLIQLPELTRFILLDPSYDRILNKEPFISMSEFKQMLSEPAKARAVVNAEKKAKAEAKKRAKAAAGVTAELLLTVEEFDLTGGVA